VRQCGFACARVRLWKNRKRARQLVVFWAVFCRAFRLNRFWWRRRSLILGANGSVGVLGRRRRAQLSQKRDHFGVSSLCCQVDGAPPHFRRGAQVHSFSVTQQAHCAIVAVLRSGHQRRMPMDSEIDVRAGGACDKQPVEQQSVAAGSRTPQRRWRAAAGLHDARHHAAP
jgi:hypothetical protein